MMATTHGLAGLLVGAVALALAPEFAGIGLAAGLIGGLAPDLDVFAEHRRTLHFPVFLPLGSPFALAPAVVWPAPATVAIGVFVAAAALHSLMDVAGGGLGLEPWRTGDDRAVYSHWHGRWIRSRGPIDYDGSPADLALALGLAGPLLLVVPAPFWTVTLVLVALSVGYVLVRKRLVSILAAVVGLVPRPLWGLLPGRLLDARRKKY